MRKGLKHSAAKCHPEGLMEKEIRRELQDETPPQRKYKARHRSSLTSQDICSITHSYYTESKTQVEVAKQYRIKPSLVR